MDNAGGGYAAAEGRRRRQGLLAHDAKASGASEGPGWPRPFRPLGGRPQAWSAAACHAPRLASHPGRGASSSSRLNLGPGPCGPGLVYLTVFALRDARCRGKVAPATVTCAADRDPTLRPAASGSGTVAWASAGAFTGKLREASLSLRLHLGTT